MWIDHDRLGVMRPTKRVNFSVAGELKTNFSGLREDIPEWRTVSNWLHLDVNPYSIAGRGGVGGDSGGPGMASIGGFRNDGTPIDFSKTRLCQSLITLTDAKIEDGGFHCVPGSHTFTLDWAAGSSARSSACNMKVQPNDPMLSCIQQIPIRKGCLLVWNSLLLHGNHPNASERVRAVQYIRAMPTTGTPYSPLCPDRTCGLYHKDFQPTALGEKLFGFAEWDAQDKDEGAAVE